MAANFEKLMRGVRVFKSEGNARGYASRANIHMWVVLGDAGEYWVATPADCSRLMTMGYGLA